MKIRVAFIVFGLLATLVAGCTSVETKSRKLQLGMTKKQAIGLLGGGYKTVGARREAGGASVEVLSYEKRRRTPLFLYFREGKLVQWGDSAQLEKAPEQ